MCARRTHEGRHVSTEMTGFGLVVWRLMAARGITTQRELARRINGATGEEVSFDTVRNYLYGRSVAHPSFVRQLVDTLSLDEEERRQLADAYAFNQGPFSRGSRGRPHGPTAKAS